MMTLHQVCEAVRQEMFVELPDGRTGVIADFKDYDWRNSQVTVTLEDGERETVSQWGDIKPALEGSFPNPFSSLVRDWKGRIQAALGIDENGKRRD
jgi:hypothetical protein